MKVNILIFIMLLFLCDVKGAKKETIDTLSRVFFINPSNGWMIGSTLHNSFILYSSDGGTSWNEQYKSNKVDISDLKFIDDQIGWAIGHKGKILYTDNGGYSWFNQVSGTTEDLSALYIVNQKKVYIGGNNGILLYTKDGGFTWHKHNLDTTYPLKNIEFINKDTGYISAITAFFQTNDGGQTWEKINIANKTAFFCINFTSLNNGWAHNEQSLFRTVNKGRTWLEVNIPQPGYFCDPIFVDDDHGWIAKVDGTEGSIVSVKNAKDKYSFSYIFSTNDGGVTWKEQKFIKSDSDHSAWILNMFFLDQLNGWAIGRGGLILVTKDGGQTWNKSSKIFLTTNDTD